MSSVEQFGFDVSIWHDKQKIHKFWQEIVQLLFSYPDSINNTRQGETKDEANHHVQNMMSANDNSADDDTNRPDDDNDLHNPVEWCHYGEHSCHHPGYHGVTRWEAVRVVFLDNSKWIIRIHGSFATEDVFQDYNWHQNQHHSHDQVQEEWTGTSK